VSIPSTSSVSAKRSRKIPDLPVPVFLGAIAAQFAALEPSWAGVQSELHLRGLLVLGALLNRYIYVHDTQLADNPHLLASYRIRHERPNAVFSLIDSLIENGVVRVAIRDATYIADRDRLVPCDSLVDVYNSWHQQHLDYAWVTPPAAPDRLSMLRDLDRRFSSVLPIRYPYADIKDDFMRRVRRAFEQPTMSTYGRRFRALRPGIRSSYEEILRRDWFSHSDIFGLLVAQGIPFDHPFVQAHGLFDEASYAGWHGARLLGCDSSSWATYDLLAGSAVSRVSAAKVPLAHADLQREALASLDAAPLALIGSLTSEEIVQLRTVGRGLFDLLEHPTAKTDLGEHEIRSNYVREICRYWEAICAHLRSKHPVVATHERPLTAFLLDHAPAVSHAVSRYHSLILNLGLDVLARFAPMLSTVDSPARRELVAALSLRFLFVGDTQAMKALASALPRRAWLAREHFETQPLHSS
jgi:hypothetical protein